MTEKLEDDAEIFNLAGEPELVTRSGHELLVQIRDENGDFHAFHIRRAKNVPEQIEPYREHKRFHYLAADLITHFEIPVVKDLSETRPEEYADALAMLDVIEAAVAT